MIINNFYSSEEQLDAIIQSISKCVENTLKFKSEVTIAVSGGKSPVELFKKLSTSTLPWNKINITLVDERLVDTEYTDSNEFLVCDYLLKNQAQIAKFIRVTTDSLYSDFEVDIALLGMGEDGHFASIFFTCNEFNDAIDLNNHKAYMITHPTEAKYVRISMTLAKIIKIKTLILNINGKLKFDTLQQAIHDKKYPIHYLINERDDLQVYNLCI